MIDFDAEEHKYKLLEYKTLGVHLSQLEGYAKFVLENTQWSLFHPDMYDVVWRVREQIMKARQELANNINFTPF